MVYILRSGLLLVSLLLVSTAVGAFAGEITSEAPDAALEPDVVGHYLSANLQQQSALRGASMEVDIDANVPKLQKQGKLRALRNISKVGVITYHMLGFDGDSAVKKEVIGRYLSAEVQSQTGPDISITPQNYKFKLKGVRSHEGRLIYVLAVSPRKKQVGLFKGEVWLDRDTYMPIRESGRFVKTPSIFLKKMEFVRFYDIQNGVSVPRKMVSAVDTRLFGPVNLSINFTNILRDPEAGPAAVASTSSVARP